MTPRHYHLTKEQILAELLTHTFLDPRYDATFKLLIADEDHPERLVHFLNSMLRLTGPDSIATACLVGTEQDVVLGFEKKIVFDIHCRNDRDEPIIAVHSTHTHNGVTLFPHPCVLPCI